MRWLALTTCALLLAAAAPPQAPPSDQPPEEDAPAKSGEAKISPPAPTTSPVPARNIVQAPPPRPRDKRNGEKAESPNWTEVGTFWVGLSQAFIGVLGLVGLFLTVLHAKRAWLAAERAHATTQRPWLVLSEYELIEPISISPDHLRVRGRMVFRNIGPALALNVTASSVLLVRPAEIEKYRHQMLSDDRAVLKAGGGHVVAPGESYRQFDFGANFRAGDLIDAERPLGQGVTMFVVVAVSYRSPNDDLPHQGSYLLLIQWKNRGDSTMDRRRIRLTDGVIPLEELEVVRFGGESAT